MFCCSVDSDTDIGFFTALDYTLQKYSAQVEGIFSCLIYKLLNASNIFSRLTAFIIAMDLLDEDFINNRERSLISLVAILGIGLRMCSNRKPNGMQLYR